MSDINWEQVKNERRVRLVAIDPRAVEHYLLIGYKEIPQINIIDVYDLPDSWTSRGISYSFEHDAFMFMIYSPEFDPVELGKTAPLLCATQHEIKLTREVMED